MFLDNDYNNFIYYILSQGKGENLKVNVSISLLAGFTVNILFNKYEYFFIENHFHLLKINLDFFTQVFIFNCYLEDKV